ncbi:hypothetical protein [Pseudonocardia alni]|uniref:hypothetical protein n=1 Tax=Pseudonocardia alni TaxID=33907 RepID=UPI00280AC59A|nr:hypothetical protein [Pseudonocardia alni]
MADSPPFYHDRYKTAAMPLEKHRASALRAECKIVLKFHGALARREFRSGISLINVVKDCATD